MTTKKTTTAGKSPTVHVDLDYPITIAGATVSYLTVRRPKGRDLFAMQEQEAKGVSEAQRTKTMLQNLCECGPDTLDELDVSDLTRLSEMIATFTQSGGQKSESSEEPS